MSATLKQRIASVPPLVWLLLLTAACLVPFAGKAFFIDDTLFLRAAEQIQKHPADFYGFNINWYGYTTPMTEAFDNPPLTSYYIAFVTLFLGWNEWTLHLAFLVPALAAVWGIFALAKNYCEHPFTAALIALLTPAFLISATAVMCDVTQLAFWVWTLVFFEKGLRTENRAAFITGGILAGLALLTKYLALSLIPLLLAYGFCVKRRPGWWLVTPTVLLVFAAGYQYLTFRLYGHGLLLNSAHEASKFRAHTYVIPWEQAVIGVTFLGASFFPVFVYAPWLWTRRVLLGIPCLIAACLLIVPRMAVYAFLIWKSDGSLHWGMFFYIAILMVAGLYVLLLAGLDLWERRDAISVLLMLWLSGMFVFTVVVNWTINARSLLPAVPAVGILAARRLSEKYPDSQRALRLRLLAPAILSAAFCLLLTKSDSDMANADRAAAIRLGEKYQRAGATTWFNEHWGFQYYIEPFGAKAIEERAPRFATGDILIITFDARYFRPVNLNSNYSGLPLLIEVGKVLGNSYLSTADPNAEAGFYATGVGVLPFGVGMIPPQYFKVYQIVKKASPPQAKKNAS